MCETRRLKRSFFFFSSRRRHTRWTGDWSSDVCSSDLDAQGFVGDLTAAAAELQHRLATDPVKARTDLAEFARGLRAFGAEQAPDYWAFRDMLVAQDPTLEWIIDSLGRNPITGT